MGARVEAREGEKHKGRWTEDKMGEWSNESIILSYTVSHGGAPL